MNNPTSDPTTTITLTLPTLLNLIFPSDDESLSKQRAQERQRSLHCFRLPRTVISKEVAELISACDPDGEITHIETLPNDTYVLWRKFYYIHSAERQLSITAASNAHRTNAANTLDKHRRLSSMVTLAIKTLFPNTNPSKDTYNSFLTHIVNTYTTSESETTFKAAINQIETTLGISFYIEP